MELFEDHSGRVLAEKFNQACEMYFLFAKEGNELQAANESLAKKVTAKQQAIGKLLQSVNQKFKAVVDRRIKETSDLQDFYTKTIEHLMGNLQKSETQVNKRRSKSCLPKK